VNVNVSTAAGPDDLRAWKDYLNQRTDRPPLGGPEWAEPIRRGYGRELECLIARDPAGRTAGVLAFHEATNRQGRQIFSAPWGLLAADQTTAHALSEKLKDIAAARQCRSASISSGSDQFDLPYKHSLRHTFVFDIAADEQTMWDGLRGRTRNAIRKAEKSSLYLVRGWTALHDFFETYSSRMTDKSVPFHNINYFQSIADTIGADGEIFAAYRNRRVEGAMLLLYGRETASYSWGAVKPSSQSVRAGQYLLWEMAKACIARGISRLDFGESSEGSGTWAFKTEFGARAVGIHYYDVMREKEAAPSQAPELQPPAALRLSLAGRVEAFMLANLPRRARSRILQSRRAGGRLF
jgi:Acetyltransferase (GNAT) domain